MSVVEAREAGRLLPEVTVRMILPPPLRADGEGAVRVLAEPVRLLVPLARDGRDAVVRVLPGRGGVEAAVLAWSARLLVEGGPERVRVWCAEEELVVAARALATELGVPGLAERFVVSCGFEGLGEQGPMVVLGGEGSGVSGAVLEEAARRAGGWPVHVMLPSTGALGEAVEVLVGRGRAPIWKDLVPWSRLRIRPVLPVRNTPYPEREALVEGVARELGRPGVEGDRAVVLRGEGGLAVPLSPGEEGAVRRLAAWVRTEGVGADEAIWVGERPTAEDLVRAGWRTGVGGERGPFVTVLCGEPVGLVWAVALQAALIRGEVGVPEASWRALGEVLEAGVLEQDEDRAAFGLIADWGMNRGNALALVRWMKAHRALVPYEPGGRAVVVSCEGVSGVWVESWQALGWAGALAEVPEGVVFHPHGCWVPDAAWAGWRGLVGGPLLELSVVPALALSAVYPGGGAAAVMLRAERWRALELS